MEDKFCYFKNRLTSPNKNSITGFIDSLKNEEFTFVLLQKLCTACALSIKSKKCLIPGNGVIYSQNESH